MGILKKWFPSWHTPYDPLGVFDGTNKVLNTPKKGKYTFKHDKSTRIGAVDTPGYMKYIKELEKELEVYKALVAELAGGNIDFNVVSNGDSTLIIRADTSRLTKAVDKVKEKYLSE